MSQAPGSDGAEVANGDAEDPSQLGPRPENLMPRTGGVAGAAAEGGADGLYRPPKLNPVAMQVRFCVLAVCNNAHALARAASAEVTLSYEWG